MLLLAYLALGTSAMIVPAKSNHLQTGWRSFGAPFLCYNKFMSKKITMPSYLRVLLTIVFLIPISVLFTWFIEYRWRGADANAAWNFMTTSPLVFSYNCVLVFLMTSIIVALCWRTFFGTGLTFALISIVTYISMEKYKVRQAPLLPEDFQMVGNVGEVAGFVDAWGIVRLVIGVGFILLGSGILEHYVRKFIGRDTSGMPLWQRWSLIPRVTLSLLAMVALLLTSEFAVHHGQQNNENIDWLDTDFVAWGQNENYAKNGFVIGFFYNLGRLEMLPPEDYSAEKIASIKATYEALKAADTKRARIDQTVDNIIVILDETFYDSELLTGLYPHSGGDPLPNLHEIFEDYSSGYMYSPEYGGGTANIEFEVFTGLSNYWANSMQYINSVPKLPNLDSVAKWSLDSGYNTTAIHGFDGSVYKRNIVYPKMGFEEFIDVYKIKYQEYENEVGKMSDSAVYKEVLDIIKSDDDKHMVGVVTMQNHAPYDSAQYTKLDYKMTGYFKNRELEHSYQSIHYADEYLGDFLEELDKLEEKTVVLWFGDHAAGIINAYITSGKKNERDLAHLTPYFIYTNFDLENKLFTEQEVRKLNQAAKLDITTEGVDLPTTTPNCLLNTMYNLLDVEKPTLMYVLDEVCETSPILARPYFEGTKPKNTEALKAYELINYDLLSGERYWAEN